MFVRVLLVLILSQLPCLAQAAGFDCAQASTAAEQMICTDNELSRLDEELSALYNAALASSAAPKPLKASQLEWLRERDRTSGRDEMLQLYQTRIEELQKVPPGGTAATGQPDEHEPAQATTSGTKATSGVSSKNASPRNGSEERSGSGSQATGAPTTGKELAMTGSTILIICFAAVITVIALYVIGIRMQAGGALNIFVDYTDALLTVLALLVPLVMALVIALMENSKDMQKTALALTVITTGALLFFPLKSAFVYNRSAAMALMALVIKFLTSFLYLFGIVFIIGGGIGAPGRMNGETEAEYRKRAAKNRTQGILLLLHHLFMGFIVYKTTRLSGFSGETLNFSFANRYAQLMTAAAEE